MQQPADLGLRPGELAGLVAVVTGAGQGIGRDLAYALGWLGAKVVVVDIDDERTGEAFAPPVSRSLQQRSVIGCSAGRR